MKQRGTEGPPPWGDRFSVSIWRWLLYLACYVALLLCLPYPEPYEHLSSLESLLLYSCWIVFLIPLFGLSVLWYRITWTPYQHTAGSRVAIALLLLPFSPVLLLGFVLTENGQVPDIPTGVLLTGLYILLPLWFTATIAMVKLVAQWQELERRIEIKRLERQHGEVTSRLKKTRSEIARLQSEEESLERRGEIPLSRRSQVEAEIARLISFDPANLSLKADGFKKQVQRLSKEQLQERDKQLERDLRAVRREHEEAKKQLETVQREQEMFNSRRRAMAQRLEQLERDDRANVGVVLRNLRDRWEGMSQDGLKTLVMRSEIERLLRDQLLLAQLLCN